MAEWESGEEGAAVSCYLSMLGSVSGLWRCVKLVATVTKGWQLEAPEERRKQSVLDARASRQARWQGAVGALGA